MQSLVKLGFLSFVCCVCFAAAESGPPMFRHKVMRIIDDRSTGDRWMLEHDPDHPGGPGKMVKVAGDAVNALQDRKAKRAPMIRAGDNVIVEEKNTVVAMRLEGVALGSAAEGDQVTVRLKAGGWLVRAIVEASGRARLAEAAQ